MLTEEPSGPVSDAALAAFRKEKKTIIQEVTTRSLRQRDEVAHHGEKAEQLIRSGIEFTTRMLEAAMVMGEVALLEDQLAWAMERLPHDGVSPEYVLNRFCTYREVVEEHLPAAHSSEIIRFLEWMITRQRELLQKGNDRA